MEDLVKVFALLLVIGIPSLIYLFIVDGIRLKQKRKDQINHRDLDL